ncbi:RNA-directed DNA polymerase from mobile element jockey [Amphibalanus amphitrite]|uniref:RNA-directed DNA polymerase from mobile element jockey n=1 Tax=Amphibalanus amphitrite TaxID=1232801 RepID=A0A6A4WDA4_AMPAM|nr:RNA-directed DNA polymerase from mobile element jockey [Amphibalanus amphitrite]
MLLRMSRFEHEFQQALDVHLSGQRLHRLLTTYGLTIGNTRHPTYRPAGSLLDVVAVSRPEQLVRAGVTRCHYGTPHDYTRVVLRCAGRTRPTCPVVWRRRLGRIDGDSFNRQLYNVDWSPVFRTQQTEEKWEAFCGIFLRQLDTVAPVAKVQQRAPGSLSVSAPTRDLMARRRQALRPGGDREDYKELNRLCRAAVRKDQQNHIQQELAKAGPSKVWRVLRPIIGNKKEVSVPNATPDALNDYYVNIGPSTAASVPQPATPVPIRLPRVTTSGFRPQPIDIESLGQLLMHMKPSNSTGIDGVSVSMFQKFYWGMGHVLLDILNSSLTTNSVPSPWKHAMVTPIPKGQGPSEPANTRPISILPAVAKVVERVVQRQLVQYMEVNRLLSATQHGYRRGHSTETALGVISDRVLEAMDAGEVSILVLLDLSKCFDVVPHRRLLDKLALYGVETEWFADYLSGHTQQVQMPSGDGGYVRSGVKPNTIGVYQGGSLSCTLYTVFANEMYLYLPANVTMVQFADDTQLLVSGKKRDLPQWLNAPSLVKYHRICVVHTLATTGKPEVLAETIGRTVHHSYQTRAAGNHMLPRIRTEAGRQRLCYDTVREYDRLPFDVTARNFRHQLKKHIFMEQSAMSS